MSSPHSVNTINQAAHLFDVEAVVTEVMGFESGVTHQ
jgi:hypothetical protein